MLAFHTACGLVALAFGAAVVFMEKGTRRHRRAGWVYVGSMALLCATSFFIFELFGGFGVFHAMALVSSVSILGGIAAPLLRGWIGEDWLEAHYMFMLWSYVGLVMATGSHFFEVVGPLFYRHTPLGATGSYLATALVCWGLPCAVGGTLIYSRKREAKAHARATLEQRRAEAVSETRVEERRSGRD